MPWSNPGLPNYEFSPDKARALLREAGLPNGFKTVLWFYDWRSLAEVILTRLPATAALSAIAIIMWLQT